MLQETYKVIRAHIGDKPYAVGEERKAVPSEVAHLIGTALEKKSIVKQNKAAPSLKNKSE